MEQGDDEKIREVLDGIGGRLRGIRTRLSMSQFDFAERVGMAPEAYGRVERGVSTPSLETLLRVCGAFGLGLDELVGWGGAGDVAATAQLGDVVRALTELSPEGVQVVGVLVAYLAQQENGAGG